ncbi:MAG: hypothetical protein ND895_16905 [Pyrinomonadaceae bacterium]|nr:hypothetical protein [Pyrinomonadaceae bacterium]
MPLMAYRAAGLLVSACGGRLESRIISFAAPCLDDSSRLERTISELSQELKAMSITVNVRETSFSGAEAMANPDTREMLSDVSEGVRLYEVFVPTHDYWRAGEATGQSMSKLAARTQKA